MKESFMSEANNGISPGSFCWVELNTSDSSAAKEFYTSLFDWTYDDAPVGPDMVYTMLKSGDKTAGALYQGVTPEKPIPPHWLTYVWVANADESAEKAT